MGCEHRDAAERFWAELRERVQQFPLALHPEKTRLIECGRFAAERRQRRGQGRPETCDFLGLTHMCSKTIAKRLRQKPQEVKAVLRERMPWPIPQQGAWRRSVLLGHDRSDAVPRNGSLLSRFRETIMRYWCQTLRRRSQRHRLTWQRMYALAEQWLPKPHILHPYPAQRLRVTTQGRSPVRSCRTPGSVRGRRGTGVPTATSFRFQSIVKKVGAIYYTGMKPQIVLDTNILIAALRSRRGAAFRLVSLLPAERFEINLSVPLVLEYEEALHQHGAALGLTTTEITDFLDFVCAKANLHEIFFLWRPMLTDPDDEMLLELAVKAQCRDIVTYNTRNFRGVEKFGIAVVTPKAFLSTLEELP